MIAFYKVYEEDEDVAYQGEFIDYTYIYLGSGDINDEDLRAAANEGGFKVGEKYKEESSALMTLSVSSERCFDFHYRCEFISNH